VTYIDVSVDVWERLPVWPGTPRVEFQRNFALEAGDEVNDTTLSFSVHTGTHIDAPLHFLRGGKSVDQIPLEVLIGPVYVAEVPAQVEAITVDVLKDLALPEGVQRLLLKTRNSRLWGSGIQEFDPNFVALTAEAAQWVVDRGMAVVGIDYLSIQRFADGPATHQILLGAGVVVIEGLDLSQVEPGNYELFCLPLKLKGVEGAPARVILKS
jgi:arylformamidase